MKIETEPGSPEAEARYEAALERIRSHRIDFGALAALNHFPLFGVIALQATEDFQNSMRSIPEIASVITPPPIDSSPDGRWYVNLISAWDHVVRTSATFSAAVVNMSLRPPDADNRVFDPDEPVNRATKAASRSGIVPILAVGNDGEEGDETMTRWSSAEWVIGVGAADESGRLVRPYSSRGSQRNPMIRPTVVASDSSGPFDGEGTSFAAPKVTDVVDYLAGFLIAVYTTSQRPSAALKPHFTDMIRRALVAMARPMQAAPHECGAGFVDPLSLKGWLRSLTILQLSNILGPMWNDISESEWKKSLAIVKDAVARDSLGTLLTGHTTVRYSIDTTYEWTRAAFVPGLLRMHDSFLLREGDTFELKPNLDTARALSSGQVFEQISILPKAQRGRMLRVGPEAEFKSIAAAVAAAQSWDTILIAPGNYFETLKLKSGITLQGSKGVSIVQPRGTIITIDGATDVTLSDLEIGTPGYHCDAVRINNSVDVIIRSCQITSDHSNALGIYQSRRCLIQDSVLKGRYNGACVLLSSQCTFQNLNVAGDQAGFLIFGPGAKLINAQVDSEWGSGIVWIYRRTQWTSWDPASVHIHPFGAYTVPASAISPSAVGQADIVGWLSRCFCSLQIEGSEIHGHRFGIATTAPDQIAAAGTSFSSMTRMRLGRTSALDLRNASIQQVQRQVGRQLRAITYDHGVTYDDSWLVGGMYPPPSEPISRLSAFLKWLGIRMDDSLSVN